MFPDDLGSFFKFDGINTIGFELSCDVRDLGERLIALLHLGPNFYSVNADDFILLKNKLTLLIPLVDDFTNNYIIKGEGDDRQSIIKYNSRMVEVLSLLTYCDSVCDKLKEINIKY